MRAQTPPSAYAVSGTDATKRRRLWPYLTLFWCLALGAPSAATAQEPTDDQYDSSIEQIDEIVGGGPGAGGPGAEGANESFDSFDELVDSGPVPVGDSGPGSGSDGGGVLAYTGADLAVLATIGAALLVAGLWLRRSAGSSAGSMR